jgi:hypothetical protein
LIEEAVLRDLSGREDKEVLIVGDQPLGEGQT